MVGKTNTGGVNITPSSTSNEKEVWKDVPGYEGRYKVSNFGRIKSLYHQCILTPKRSGAGYRGISLSKYGVKKRFYIHRLVAQCFLSKPHTDANEVNHKDFDRANNHVSNLEWVTRKENCRHAYENGRLDFRRPRRRDNKTGKPGVCADSGGYVASIQYKGKSYYLGRFKKLEEAIKAREAAERRLLSKCKHLA
jgi:hypothetical protein